MFQISNDKRQKDQRNILPIGTQQKVSHTQEKDRNTYVIRIYLLFVKTISLFLITKNISLKSKRSKIKDIIFSFEYCNYYYKISKEIN